MKLTERSNGFYLEDITATDVRFANLAGRMTGSQYDDPNRPKHVYVLWIEDDDILNVIRQHNGNIVEKVSPDNPDHPRHSVQFKAYPKKRINRDTGKEEQMPKAMLRTTQNTVRLESESFGLLDSAHIETVDIRFHFWKYAANKPDSVLVIDEIWLTVDEGAGESDESYLDEKYGYEEEELPFN